MTGVLLDSVILIDHFNGVEDATNYIREMHPVAMISVITRAEVLVGFDASHLDQARKILDLFPCMPISRSVADRAAELRRQWRWKLPDALQAAVAQENNVRLATRNTRDFPPEKHAFVVVPYSVKP
jgi:predicted nucleic acid-binding protein